MTGNKFSRAEIIAALRDSDNDPDDAIELLLSSKKPSSMFDAVKKAEEQEEETTKFASMFKKQEAPPKPQKLISLEQQLSKDYFEQFMVLMGNPSEDLAFLGDKNDQSVEDKIRTAQDIFTNSTSREYAL